MLLTWATPAVVRSEIRTTYPRCAPGQALTAIIWTQAKPADESSLLQQSSTDIEAVKKWIEREQDLGRIRKFGDNWDGLGADRPDEVVMKRADFFLRVLKDRYPASPPMRVVLSADGSVAFEWADSDKFVQAEIADSVTVEWMVAVQGEATRFEVEPLEELSSSGAAKQGQEWQPAPAVVDEPAYASAH